MVKGSMAPAFLVGAFFVNGRVSDQVKGSVGAKFLSARGSQIKRAKSV